MLFKDIIQHASYEFRKRYKKHFTHERCNKEMRNNEP